MGRQKKNELDAILEQLKKSYATDVDEELEDSLLETEESEEDAELASVLEKIFASGSDDVNEAPAEEIPSEDAEEINGLTNEDQTVENMAPEEMEIIVTSDDNETINSVSDLDGNNVEEEIEDISPTELQEMAENTESDVAEIIETYEDEDEADMQSEDNSFEEDRVDDVLRMMFHQDAEDVSGVEVQDPDNTEPSDEGNGSLYENDEPAFSLDTDAFNEEDADQVEAPVEYGTDEDEFSEETIEQSYDEDQAVLDEDKYDSAIFSSEYDEFDEEIDIDECDELGDIYIDEIIAEDEEAEEDEPVSKAKLVLSADDYTEDVLQYSLSDMSIFKPEKDMDYSMHDNRESVEDEDTSYAEESVCKTPTSEISDNDVSLLLKLGYGGEVASSISDEHARAVVVEKNNEYVPQKHRITHGFSGREFSGNTNQISEINKKYKTDKVTLLVVSMIMSVIAITMFIVDILASQAQSDSDYAVLIFFEVFLVLAMILTLLFTKRLIIGFLGIARFEANSYSMLCLTMAEYLIYCIAIGFVYALSPDYTQNGVYVAFGGYVSIYASFVSWAEYIDCYKESQAFNIVSRGDLHCILEKKIGGKGSSNEKSQKHTKITYNVKRSRFVSGYFRRIIDKETTGMKIVLVVGVVPFVAILACLIIASMTENAILGINAAGYILFSIVPLSAIFSPALIELIHSLRLFKSDSVFIGEDSVSEYARVNSIAFGDYDAVEITAITEINPNNSEESSKKWINIACNVFDALGGPLSKTMKGNRKAESNVGHEITINSIAENGIDIYFDSSMNVLVGDRQYMLAHNIKVKTDTNLSTAIKGVNRTVLYLAFDGVPQIGFIITSKINPSFLETVELLEKNKIKIAINTYEPEINDFYFESNKVENALTVQKNDNYEHAEPSFITDSGIVAPDPHKLCGAIVYSREIMKDRKLSKKIRLIQTIVGIVIAALLVTVSCIPSGSQFVTFVQSNSLLIFYAAAFLGMIPNVVQTVKLIMKK